MATKLAAAPGKGSVGPATAAAPAAVRQAVVRSTTGEAVADRLLAMTAAPGLPLDAGLRAYFEPRLGASLGNVLVHPNTAAVATSGARAVAIGRHVGFAPGRYQPASPAGRALIGHELAHAVQQARPGVTGSRGAAETEADSGGRVALARPPGPAFALEDYQHGTVSDETISHLSVTDLQRDIDAISAFLDRQLAGTAETDALFEARGRLQARLAGLLRTAMVDPPRQRQPPAAGRQRPQGGGPRRAPAAPAVDPLAAGPIAIPRILAERRSMPTDDPEAVQQEVNRIVAWLQHPDVSRDDRQILRMELNTLAPQFEQARTQEAARNHAARVQAQFASAEEGVPGLRQNIGVIESIHNDPAEPLAAFIYRNGERLRIGRDQAEALRLGARQQLQQALRRAQSDSEMARQDYLSMLALNREYPVVSAISGWLGGTDDPRAALNHSNQRLQRAHAQASAQLAEGHLSAAIEPLLTASTEGRKMRMAAQAFRDGHIEGAEAAVTGLTFVRDAAFAIDGALLAVVAAPFVAGAVGAGGLGLTGTMGTLTTIGGTGLVVGGTTGTVGAVTTYGGERLAGNSHDQALAAAGTEGRRRFGEGFAAGAGGATTRLVTAALPAGGSMVTQLGGRFVAQGSGAFVGTTSNSLIMGADLDDALLQGGRSALLTAPSVLAGAPFANGSWGQTVASTGVGTLVGYGDARLQGQSHEDAMRGATLSLTTALVTSTAPGMRGLDQRMEAHGQAFGGSVRNQARAGVLGLQLRLGPMAMPTAREPAPMAIAGASVPGPAADVIETPVRAQAMAGSGSATPPRPPGVQTPRDAIPGQAAHDSWVANVLANRMGVRPPPLPRPNGPPVPVGHTRYGLRTMDEAMRVYDDFRARAPGREVGIYRDAHTGEYAVKAGNANSVGYPSRGNGMAWDNILHNHPNLENVLAFRNPSGTDVDNNQGLVGRRLAPETTLIEHEIPGGGRQFTAVTQFPDGRIEIRYQLPNGQMAEPRRFASIADYKADQQSRTVYVNPDPGPDPHNPQNRTYQSMIDDIDAMYARTRRDADVPPGGMSMTGIGRQAPAAAPDVAATPAPPLMLGPGPRPPLMLGPGAPRPQPRPSGPEVFADLGRELGMTPGSPGTGMVWSVTPGGTVFATPPLQGVPIHAPDGNLPPASYFAGRPRTLTLSGPLQPDFTPFDVLPGRSATSQTLNQVRNTRGANGRGDAGERFVAQGSPGSRREVTLALPADQTRRSDVLSPTPAGTVNQEVKNYQRYRGANSGPLEVEWTRFMQTEIDRDAMLMYYHGHQPVWVFTDAPPSAAMRAALQAARIPFIVATDRQPVP